MAARRYVYGLRLPHVGRDVAIEQMRLAARYRNTLAEIELRRRAAGEEALRVASPELVALDTEIATATAAIEAALKEIGARNSDARRRTGTAAERTALAQQRVARRDLFARRKTLRQALYADDSPLRARLSEIDATANEEVKLARAGCGLYWGTYCTVEEAARGFRRGAPPRFLRWDRSGTISVQIQHGIDVLAVHSGNDRRLRLVPIPGARGRRPTHELFLRIGSEGRDPIWFQALVKMHRPLPTGTRIKWAHVQRNMIGPRDEWRLHVVVEGEARAFAPSAVSAGLVAVDLGWRLVPRGLRVAYWVGDDGAHDELVIPAHELSRWELPPQLRAIRDLHFNTTRQLVNDWLAQQPMESIPEWLAQQSATLAQWRSSARLRELVERWARSRFAGDGEIFALAEEWSVKERHLHAWQAAQDARTARWRDDRYRCFAAEMARRYTTVVLEDANWREVIARPDSAAAEAGDGLRRNSRIAAVGRLAQILGERLTVQRVAAEYTTQRCHGCQALESFDAGAHLMHTCSHCGARWDQDESAARLLLGLALGTVASVPVAQGPAGRTRESSPVEAT